MVGGDERLGVNRGFGPGDRKLRLRPPAGSPTNTVIATDFFLVRTNPFLRIASDHRPGIADCNRRSQGIVRLQYMKWGKKERMAGGGGKLAGTVDLTSCFQVDNMQHNCSLENT